MTFISINVNALVGTFNQEKAQVGDTSAIVKLQTIASSELRLMGKSEAQ